MHRYFAVHDPPAVEDHTRVTLAPSDAPATPQPRSHTTILAAVVMVVTWGSSAVFVRIALDGYSPAHLTLLRFLIISAALLVVAIVTRMRVPPLRDWPAIGTLAFVGITLTQLAFAFGIESVDPGTATFLIATLPVMAALLARFLLGERLTGIGWTGIVITLVGTGILVAGQHEAVGFTTGALILLGAALSEALYYIFQKPLLRRYNSLELSTWALIASTIPLLVFLPGLPTEISQASFRETGSIVFIALGAGVVGYVCMAVVNTHWPASVAAILMAALPPVALVTAWLVLDVVPPFLSIVGGLISLSGVWLVTRYGKAPPVMTTETPVTAPTTA
jgi:drug/metabolite transporter (DMT)-like permease